MCSAGVLDRLLAAASPHTPTGRPQCSATEHQRGVGGLFKPRSCKSSGACWCLMWRGPHGDGWGACVSSRLPTARSGQGDAKPGGGRGMHLPTPADRLPAPAGLRLGHSGQHGVRAAIQSMGVALAAAPSGSQLTEGCRRSPPVSGSPGVFCADLAGAAPPCACASLHRCMRCMQNTVVHSISAYLSATQMLDGCYTGFRLVCSCTQPDIFAQRYIASVPRVVRIGSLSSARGRSQTRSKLVVVSLGGQLPAD